MLPLFYLFSFLSSLEAYKILVYSANFGHSHVKFMGSIADTLTDAGFDVTVLQPIFSPHEFSEKKNGLKSTKKVSQMETMLVQEWLKIIYNDAHPNQVKKNPSAAMKMVWTSNQRDLIRAYKTFLSWSDGFANTCEAVIKNTTLLEILKNEKFDLAVVEPFAMCPFALFEEIKVKAFASAVASAKMDHISSAMGEPGAPSYVPASSGEFGTEMTFYEKALNVFAYFSSKIRFNSIGDREYEVVRKYLPNARDWRDVLPESVYLFTNSIPILDFPHPTLSKVIPIGGISTNIHTTKLSEKWDSILNERPQTVLISFGSNAKSVDMPDKFKSEFVELFKALPEVTFVWKYENEEEKFVDHLKNVHLTSWMPQNDLLADDRLTVFVTHGGLASITEVASLGKPSVVIPLFADQFRNAHMLTRQNVSIAVQKENLNDHRHVLNALKTILNDAKYSENAKRLAEMIASQPTDAKETLVKHVEFAARFGKQPQMDPYGRKLNFLQYYLIDLLSFTVLTVFVISVVLVKIVKTLRSLLVGGKKKIE